MTHYLSKEEIRLAHFKLIERYSGSHGIRSIERIESVGAAPKQMLFGIEQYPDLFQKAAVYLRKIVGDHPFADGNKRTAVTTAIMFLQQNGLQFKAHTGEIENFSVRVATQHLDIPTIAEWLKSHCI